MQRDSKEFPLAASAYDGQRSSNSGLLKLYWASKSPTNLVKHVDSDSVGLS